MIHRDKTILHVSQRKSRTLRPTAGEDCKAAAQRYSSTFAAQDHTILVVLGAKCDGEATVASAGYIKNNRSVRAIIFIKLH